MAEIVLSDEETKALVNRVIEDVHRNLVSRITSDLYHSAVREAAKKITAELSDRIKEKASAYFTEETVDAIIARALREDRGYNSVNYILSDIMQKSKDVLQKKVEQKINDLFTKEMK